MLLIHCPFCGPRAEHEFRYGDQAAIVRPPPSASDGEWAAYLFVRENPAGPHRERWVHGSGCRQWFLVERDTVTHAILGTSLINAARGLDQ
jgi:heterotetrameric sarcosine oxidase delta subunit